ncbi:MAG: poly(R)-hydroxyalkanoic acid synthase subunit PhaE [Candidatus Methanoperedens sp.]
MDRSSPKSPNNFFDQWSKTCEESFGHIGKLPAVGPSREKTEKMMKVFPLFMNFYNVWMDSISDFSKLSLEAMNRMHDKTANMGCEISPEKNKEIYNIWIETYSDTFKEFLGTGHFARDMGKITSVLIDAQKYNREMLEDNLLKPMNLPTSTDIDELNRELYSLKKTVKELTRKINELSQEK